MTPRVAALALAATPLLAAPAFADGPDRGHRPAVSDLSLSVGDASFYINVGHDDWRGRNGRYYRSNEWGQRPWEVRQLRRDTLQRCAGAIQRQGYRIGFRDVDIDDDFRIRQIGPRGFRVRFDDVEFEGRRREFVRDVSCTVRHGNVVDITGLPQPGHHGYRHGGRYDNDWNHGRDWRRGGDWGRGGHDRWDHDDRDDDHGRRTGPGGQRSYGDDGELRGGRRAGS